MEICDYSHLQILCYQQISNTQTTVLWTSFL